MTTAPPAAKRKQLVGQASMPTSSDPQAEIGADPKAGIEAVPKVGIGAVPKAGIGANRQHAHDLIVEVALRQRPPSLPQLPPHEVVQQADVLPSRLLSLLRELGPAALIDRREVVRLVAVEPRPPRRLHHRLLGKTSWELRVQVTRVHP